MCVSGICGKKKICSIFWKAKPVVLGNVGPAVCFSPHASGLPLPSGLVDDTGTVWVNLQGVLLGISEELLT